jgi:hypothetical protein
LLVLPLLTLTMLMNVAVAAPLASFSAAASGTTSRLSLTVTVNVAEADVGLNGNYYLGYQHKGAWAFLTQQGWVPYTSGTVPVYAIGPLASASGQVISNADSTVPTSAITGNVAVSPAAALFLTGFSLIMVGTTSATSPQVTGNL